MLSACVRALAPPHQSITEESLRAIALLAQRWHAFSDLRTLADIRVERGEERDRLTGVLLASAPASVRFEALSPLGTPMYLVTIHDGLLTAYDAGANEGVVGPATVATAERLLSLPFDANDLVGVLSGRPAPPGDVRAAEILPPDELGRSIELSGAVNRVRYWMDFQTGVVHQVQITGGRYEVRVTYSRDGDGPLQGFQLSAAQGHITGSVAYRQPVFDAGIEPDRFRLTLPETAKIQQLR